jgi:glutaredoxin
MNAVYDVVTVYTQPDCLPCERVIDKLHEADIAIEIVDLTKDRLAKDYVTRVLRLTSTPIVEARGFLPFSGYQPEKLQEIINEFRLPIDVIHDYVYEGDEE